MATKVITEAQKAYIRAEAQDVVRTLMAMSADDLDTLLAGELPPSSLVVISVKMFATERLCPLEQFYKALLYCVLRRNRTAQEAENLPA